MITSDTDSQDTQVQEPENAIKRVSYDFSSLTLDKESYDSLTSRFNPLDLLFFKGGDLPSKFIQLAEEIVLGDGMFSHVGILVSKDILPHLDVLEDDEWYVWESTMSIYIPHFQEDNVVNIETGKGKLGVQIRKLKDVIESYTDEEKGTFVAWAPLKDNPWEDSVIRATVVQRLRKVHENVHDLGYERNPVELSLSIMTSLRRLLKKLMKKIILKRKRKNKSTKSKKIKKTKKSKKATKSEKKIQEILEQDIILNNPDDIENSKDINESEMINESTSVDDSYFCSELIAYIYKELGILNSDIEPEYVVPMDFLGYDTDKQIPDCTKHAPVKIII
jgi:hypothetical protein